MTVVCEQPRRRAHSGYGDHELSRGKSSDHAVDRGHRRTSASKSTPRNAVDRCFARLFLLGREIAAHVLVNQLAEAPQTPIAIRAHAYSAAIDAGFRNVRGKIDV